MTENFDCPSPFCSHELDRAGADEYCPSCKFPVGEWLEHHRGHEPAETTETTATAGRQALD